MTTPGALWLQVELEVEPSLAGRAGLLLTAFGAAGWEQRDASTLLDADEGRVLLLAWLPAASAAPEQVRASLAARVAGAWGAAGAPGGAAPPRVSVRPVADPGWAQEYRRFFRSVPVGRRLLVRPPWEPAPPDGARAVLTLDPGLAFGTGTHPTTRLCLEVIERAPPVALLDVGCGSGILCIAAALLGTERALGVDIDPVAVEVATENAGLNGVGGAASFESTPVAELEGLFPLVVANMLAPILLRIGAHLLPRVARGGRLVLSGLLDHEAERVLAAFAGWGGELLERHEGLDDGGETWVALVLRPSAASQGIP